MSQTHDMPFDIMDVAGLLHIRVRRPSGRGYYADCPFCGDKRGKLHLNTEFDGWKCNYCGEHGGLLDLYGRLKHMNRSEAYREICDALQSGVYEFFPTIRSNGGRAGQTILSRRCGNGG